MINLPKEFNIFGETYKIKRIKNLISNNSVYGECDKAKKEIRLDSKLSGKLLFITLFHELNHAVFEETGLSQTMENSLEEAAADNIAKMMVNFINHCSKKPSCKTSKAR